MAEGGAGSGTPLPLQFVERIYDVARQVEAISDLNRVWRSNTDAFTNSMATVACDDFGASVRAQPTRKSRRLVIRQHINRASDCQVYNEQAITQRCTV
jgi:hypothetical protein